jgi:hypothetical protein
VKRHSLAFFFDGHEGLLLNLFVMVVVGGHWNVRISHKTEAALRQSTPTMSATWVSVGSRDGDSMNAIWHGHGCRSIAEPDGGRSID